MVGGSYVVYYPRYTDREQTSRNCPRTPAPSGTGTYVAPGSPATTAEHYRNPVPIPARPRDPGGLHGARGGEAGASGSRHADVRASRECREQTRWARVSAWVRAGGERGEHGDVRVRPVGVHRRIHRWSRVKVGHRGYTPPVLFHVMLLNEPAGGNVCPIVIPLLTTRTLCTCDTPWQTAP